MPDGAPGQNPWLHIPAEEYEAHMASEAVGQLTVLSELMAGVLRRWRPASLAVPGCTTGNGFEHVDPGVTKCVVGIDINRAYLDELRQKHGSRLPGLELICADVQTTNLPRAAFDVVHAALLFEHAGPARALPGLVAGLKPAGVMTVVLQLPSTQSGPVSETAAPSLGRLKSSMRLVSPEGFRELAGGLGLVESEVRTIGLPGGKGFYVGTYRFRDAAGKPGVDAR